MNGVNATAPLPPPLQTVMQFCFSELSYAPAALCVHGTVPCTHYWFSPVTAYRVYRSLLHLTAILRIIVFENTGVRLGCMVSSGIRAGIRSGIVRHRVGRSVFPKASRTNEREKSFGFFERAPIEISFVRREIGEQGMVGDVIPCPEGRNGRRLAFVPPFENPPLIRRGRKIFERGSFGEPRDSGLLGVEEAESIINSLFSARD